ncbi:MAG: hypothetical protein ABH869_00715 [Candidatus Omnitrophota bacterium]
MKHIYLIGNKEQLKEKNLQKETVVIDLDGFSVFSGKYEIDKKSIALTVSQKLAFEKKIS